MLISKYSGQLKGHVVTAIFVMLALLFMVAPAMANTSHWAFQGNVNGIYLSGSDNGVWHHMNSGNLTNSGSFWATNSAPYPLQPWKFEVWKEISWWPNSKVCETGWITPNSTVGLQKSFSKSCGSISSADYYLVAWRSASDGRAYSGGGNFNSQ